MRLKLQRRHWESSFGHSLWNCAFLWQPPCPSLHPLRPSSLGPRCPGASRYPQIFFRPLLFPVSSTTPINIMITHSTERPADLEVHEVCAASDDTKAPSNDPGATSSSTNPGETPSALGERRDSGRGEATPVGTDKEKTENLSADKAEALVERLGKLRDECNVWLRLGVDFIGL